MQLFLNSELSELITDLDLGIVAAGGEQSYIFYLYNESEADLVDIVGKIDHPEVVIVRAPKELAAKGKAVLEIRWSPSVTVKEGLHATISFDYNELWR